MIMIPIYQMSIIRNKVNSLFKKLRRKRGAFCMIRKFKDEDAIGVSALIARF